MASNLEEANKKFMKKILRGYFDPIYTEEFKLPKYNGRVTVMNGPAAQILARSGKFDKMEHLKRADLLARAAINFENQWSKVANKASMEAFGRPYEFTDYKISGIARDEYSEKRKNQLRSLAHGMGIFKTLARAHADAAKLQGRYKFSHDAVLKMNPRPRKYVTVIVGQGNYGGGWEDETAYLDDKEGRAAAKVDRKAYRENSQYPFRLIHRKVKIEDYEKGNF